MATTLQSPGVLVSVVDDSFYNPAAPGTVPMIFVASASNKQNGSGTGIAPGTLDANAGQVWTISSQLDLATTFGTPYFETVSNNPVNGGEINEYGLQAAYSLLGISSKAYVVRADVDLSQLTPLSSAPTGAPVSGTYWVNSANSSFGIQQWNNSSQTYTTQTPLIIDDSNNSTAALLTTNPLGISGTYQPTSSFGTIGSYAMVVTSTNTNAIWFKNTDNIWVEVGSNNEGNITASGFAASTCWQTSWPVVTSTGFVGNISSGTQFSVNSSTVTISNTSTAGVALAINQAMHSYGVGARVINGYLNIYSSAATNNGNIYLSDGSSGAVLTSLGLGTAAATYYGPGLAIQPHTQVPSFGNNGNATGSVWIKTTSPNGGANWSVNYYNGATSSWGTVSAPIYSGSAKAIYAMDTTGGSQIPVGTLFIKSNYDGGTGTSTNSTQLAEFKVFRRNATSPTTISYALPSTFKSFNTTTTSTFTIKESLPNTSSYTTATYTVSIPPGSTPYGFVAAFSAAGLTYTSASYNPSVGSSGTISISHSLGGEILLQDGTNAPLTGNTAYSLGFTPYNMFTQVGTLNLYQGGYYDTFSLYASNWKPLVYEALPYTPYTTPTDGQLWYDSATNVDIMYNNGSKWVGYLNAFPNSDPNGPQVVALAPTTQSDGTPLVTGDIWISTSPIDSYGQLIYIWNSTSKTWVLQDVQDHTSPNGWVFADARWSTSGQATTPATTVQLLSSNYVDPDVPAPNLYPAGTRLWNTRNSGFNVKKYVSNYINIYANNGLNAAYNNDVMDGANPYFADRWVTASLNNAFGVGTFGRLAQRAVVVSALKSLIDTNQTIRDTDSLVFNLIACPGYPETIQDMVEFNTDIGQTAFVLGDTPFRLEPNATTLAAWGNNTNGALDNGDLGAVTHDDYMSLHYPNGYTTDNYGNYIVVPPSHMMLYTIANSDNVSYPWFAPAGINRGIVQNATSVGYVDPTTSEFVQASIYQGLRDVLAGVEVNPIATLPGSGLTVMGQYTRASASSALDRINVARLVCYLRRQLGILARPFLFEPNDAITRAEFKGAIDGMLLELVSQRALYDFISVCDESNNTPTRIDRNELWADIAIEPVKAAEFIYIPLRLVNTGSITSGS